MSVFFSPRVHYLMTLVHITCAMFWLGWMVFFSLILVPVLKRTVPDEFYRLRAQLQSRTRAVVNVLLVLIVLTGLYNMEYRGLMDLRVLLLTEHGLWFVFKLFLAVLLMGLYLLAPRFQESDRPGSPAEEERRRNLFLYVHGTILMVGMTVGYLGIGVGG